MSAQAAKSKSSRRDGLVGKTFGQYHVLSLIQRGGMGEIYLAELAPQRIRVVVKRLQDVHTSDDRYVEMFHNEAALMSKLEHPNIVKVLGVPVIEGKQCLVMEFVRGRNLQQVVKRLRELGRRLPPSMAVYVMRKVLLGLQEAHQVRSEDGQSLELVHRDVKPGNVLLSYAGDVKITDFGIAKSLMQNRMTTAGVVKGTVRYLSPEQIRSEKVTFRSDLFSCASVLVELLTDKALFDRGPVAPTLMAILNNDRPPIAELLPFRAPELAQVLETALRIQPERRFESAYAFSQALGTALRSVAPASTDDELGSLLRQLFQGSPGIGDSEAEDITYLLHNDTPSSSSRIRPPSRPRGSQPLDAQEFSETSPSELVELDWPEEVVRADARAEAMLNEAIVIEPVEPAQSQGQQSPDFDELTPEDLAEDIVRASHFALKAQPKPMEAPAGLRPESSGSFVEQGSRPPPLPGRGPPPLPGTESSGGHVPYSGTQPGMGYVDGPPPPWVSGQWPSHQAWHRSSGGWVPVHAEPPRPETSKLRLYLLVGCLSGVLLTSVIMVLVHFGLAG